MIVNGRKVIASSLLAIVLLLVVIVPLSTLQGGSTYDPWLDYNEDGIVDARDLQFLGQSYGSTGDSTKNVKVDHFNSNVTSYDISVPAQSTNNVNITTDGYTKVSLGFSVNSLTVPVSVRTGFLFDSYYAYMNAFEIGGGAPTSQLPNAMWLRPPVIDLGGTSVGYRFVVDVNVNLSNLSHAWRAKVDFNPAYLKAVQVKYTRISKSQFFMDCPTVPSTPTINNEEGYIIHEESLQGNEVRPAGSGSLFYIEFEVIWPTNTMELAIDKEEINPQTYILDGNLNQIQFQTYGTLVSWLYKTQTYDVIGPTLRVDFHNPNSDEANVHLDVYLATASGEPIEKVYVTNWPLNQGVLVNNWPKEVYARNLMLKGTKVSTERMLIDYERPYPNQNLPYSADRDDEDHASFDNVGSTLQLVYNGTYMYDRQSLNSFQIYGCQVSLAYNGTVYWNGVHDYQSIQFVFHLSLGLTSPTGYYWTPLLSFTPRTDWVSKGSTSITSTDFLHGLWFSVNTPSPTTVNAYEHLALRIEIYAGNVSADTADGSVGVALGTNEGLVICIPIVENP